MDIIDIEQTFGVIVAEAHEQWSYCEICVVTFDQDH